MEYQCSVCHEKIEGGALGFIQHTETHIIEVIKRKHPSWVEKDGLCGKCMDYYRKQIQGDPQT